MKLPEAIQRQVEEADALEQQLYGQTEQVNDQQQADPEVVQNEPQAAPQEHKEPEAPPVNDVEPVSKENDAAYWKQRFATVQGMLNSQSAQMTEQLRLANDRIQALTNDLERQRSAEQTQATNVNDNDAETFGEDLVDAMRRQAKQAVAQEIDQMQAYIRQLEDKLGSVNKQVAVSAQDQFLNNLAKLVPDYESVNGEQAFLNWLGEVDPVYGVARQSALDSAANALDAQRVASVFNAYKSLTRKQDQSVQKQQARQELERQTAPVAARSTAQPAAQGRVFSLAEYEAALDPRNVQRMGRAQAEALYAEAEAALAEGRVRY